MNEVTRILSAIEQGDAHAAAELLLLVYDELRKLAAQKLAHEKPGQTLQATALVHEAYLRLVASPQCDAKKPPSADSETPDKKEWNSRGHFFAAAAEAMRRILIEQARRKQRVRHGGDRKRVDLKEALSVADTAPEDLLALDDVLSRLEAADALAAQVVKLRYFVGLTMPETAEALGISLRQTERNWTYARTWLARALAQGDADEAGNHPQP
jgi:RNA polymerase sigma factor (sigma-70 family)